MISVFNYTNYRLFLKDFYQENKSSNFHYSHRYIAQKLGLKSSGHFTLILSGKTNISSELIYQIASFCKFTKKESEYFEIMVRYNQAKTQQEKCHNFELMSKFKGVSTKVLQPDQYEFYQKWYYSAIHLLLSFYKFDGGDYKKLGRMLTPSISSADAKKAVLLLERLGFAKKADDGYYVPCTPGISTMLEGHSLALNNYINEMLQIAQKAVNTIPKEERHFSWVGVSMSQETYEAACEELRAVRTKILSMAQNDQNPIRAFHFSMQMVPITEDLRRQVPPPDVVA